MLPLRFLLHLPGWTWPHGGCSRAPCPQFWAWWLSCSGEKSGGVGRRLGIRVMNPEGVVPSVAPSSMLPSTLANKWAFPDCVLLLPLLAPSTPGPGGRGSGVVGWAPDPHHFPLQCTHLPVLPFQIFRESTYSFQMHLSNEPSLWASGCRFWFQPCFSPSSNAKP